MLKNRNTKAFPFKLYLRWPHSQIAPRLEWWAAVISTISVAKIRIATQGSMWRRRTGIKEANMYLRLSRLTYDRDMIVSTSTLLTVHLWWLKSRLLQCCLERFIHLQRVGHLPIWLLLIEVTYGVRSLQDSGSIYTCRNSTQLSRVQTLTRTLVNGPTVAELLA